MEFIGITRLDELYSNTHKPIFLTDSTISDIRRIAKRYMDAKLPYVDTVSGGKIFQENFPYVKHMFLSETAFFERNNTSFEKEVNNIFVRWINYKSTTRHKQDGIINTSITLMELQFKTDSKLINKMHSGNSVMIQDSICFPNRFTHAIAYRIDNTVFLFLSHIGNYINNKDPFLDSVTAMLSSRYPNATRLW